MRFGRRVYEAATGPKEGLFVPGGGHSDLYLYPAIPARVIDFVHRQVPAKEVLEQVTD